MKWSVVVTSAPRDEPTLEASLESIMEAGWEKPIVIAEPGTEIPLGVEHGMMNERRLHPWRNFLQALDVALSMRPDAIAIFQDDVEVASGLCGWLQGNDLLGRGILSLYTARRNHGPERGWQRLSHADRSLGALGFVFPPEAALALLKNPCGLNYKAHVDFNVGRFAFRDDVPLWFHRPSLIRHTGTTSTISGQPITEDRQCEEFLDNVTGYEFVSGRIGDGAERHCMPSIMETTFKCPDDR